MKRVTYHQFASIECYMYVFLHCHTSYVSVMQHDICLYIRLALSTEYFLASSLLFIFDKFLRD